MQVEVHDTFGKLPLTKDQVIAIVEQIAESVGLEAHSISIVFVDDERLSKMHGEYLDDPTPTDVITFDLGEDKIEGEIYISIERANDQAKQFKCALSDELLRLIVHGLLHLKGYNDLAEEERREMKVVENRLVESLSGKFL